MRIIIQDSLDMDYIPESFYRTNLSREEAEVVIKDLNNKIGRNYYKIVEDSYVLNTESIYDANGDIPSFEVFSNMCSLYLLSIEEAINLYQLKYPKANKLDVMKIRYVSRKTR